MARHRIFRMSSFPGLCSSKIDLMDSHGPFEPEFVFYKAGLALHLASECWGFCGIEAWSGYHAAQRVTRPNLGLAGAPDWIRDLLGSHGWRSYAPRPGTKGIRFWGSAPSFSTRLKGHNLSFGPGGRAPSSGFLWLHNIPFGVAPALSGSF